MTSNSDLHKVKGISSHTESIWLLNGALMSIWKANPTRIFSNLSQFTIKWPKNHWNYHKIFCMSHLLPFSTSLLCPFHFYFTFPQFIFLQLYFFDFLQSMLVLLLLLLGLIMNCFAEKKTKLVCSQSSHFTLLWL